MADTDEVSPPEAPRAPRSAHEVAARAFSRAAVSGAFGAMAFLLPAGFILNAEEAPVAVLISGLAVAGCAFVASLAEEFAVRGAHPLRRILISSLGFPVVLYALIVWLLGTYARGPVRGLLEVVEGLQRLPRTFSEYPGPLLGATLAYLLPFAGFLVVRTRVAGIWLRYALATALGLGGGLLGVLSLKSGNASEATTVVVGVAVALFGLNFGFDYGERLAARAARRYEAWGSEES